MRVFLGGSRRVSRLNASIREKLDELVQRHLQVIIGDANGADRAMQQQLADWGYADVEVFYVGRAPRNNVGAWPMRRVSTASNLKGFEFYAAKDREMSREAECGLMLWDGQSRGTLANVENLLRVGKPVALYIGPARRFVALKSSEDLDALRNGTSSSSVSTRENSTQTEFGLGDQPRPTRKSRRRTA